MGWNTITFETARGEKPIDKFFKRQSVSTQSKIVHLLDLLEIHGNMLRMPYSKQLYKNLYELRMRGTLEIRIFYCFRGHKIILLHAFKKKTQKTPRKEIEITLKRIDP